MLNSLKNMGKEGPKTSWFKACIAFEDLACALRARSEEGLSQVLKGLSAPLSEGYEEYVKQQLLESEWILGFNKVVDHFKINVLEHERHDGYTRTVDSMLIEAAASGQFWLVEHLWGQEKEKVQDKCVRSYLGPELAIILAKNDQSSQIGGSEKRKLLLSCLHKLSEGNLKEDREGLKEAIRVVLSNSPPWITVGLWKGICKLDDVNLLKELLKDGVIGGGNLQAVCSAEQIVADRSNETMIRMSSLYASTWDGESANWTKKGSRDETFTVADLVCLFSRGQHKVLASLLEVKEFRDQLMASALARHSFIHLNCKLRTYGEGELIEELALQGAPMQELKADGDMNPLHVLAIDRTIYAKSDYDIFMKLLSIQPEWLTQKDGAGITPSERLRMTGKEELLAQVEAWELKNTVKEKKGEPQPDGLSQKKGLRV